MTTTARPATRPGAAVEKKPGNGQRGTHPTSAMVARQEPSLTCEWKATTLYGVVWDTPAEGSRVIDGRGCDRVAYRDRETAEAMGRAAEFLLQLYDPKRGKRYRVVEVTVC